MELVVEFKIGYEYSFALIKPTILPEIIILFRFTYSIKTDLSKFFSRKGLSSSHYHFLKVLSNKTYAKSALSSGGPSFSQSYLCYFSGLFSKNS